MLVCIGLAALAGLAFLVLSPTGPVEMVRIGPGTFTMGSAPSEKLREDNEGPAHTVTIAYSFEVSRYPITRGQWRDYLKESGRSGSSNCVGWNNSEGKLDRKPEYSWQNPGFSQEDSHPVVCVTWREAKDYTAWLSQKTGRHYRLLSEAEYEYVLRAGTRGAYSWGDDDPCRHVNVADAGSGWKKGGDLLGDPVPCDDGYRYTSPVSHFPANAFGVHDMAGNVLSWTQDCAHDSYAGAPGDGRSWESEDCSKRVLRGAVWLGGAQVPRSAMRIVEGNVNDVDTPSCVAGFRVAAF